MPRQLVPGKPACPVRSVCRQSAAPLSGRQILFPKSSPVSNTFRLLSFSVIFTKATTFCSPTMEQKDAQLSPGAPAQRRKCDKAAEFAGRGRG